MHLLYLDDSGSVPNANEKYFVLAGLSIFEAQADWFSREMDKLAESIDAKNPASVEFHASAQYARRVAPWNTMTRDDAHGVTKSVLQIVADSYDTARIFACAVEKSSVLNDDPVAVAFEDLCSRFDMFLSGLRASGDRQRGLLVLDKSTHETSLQQLTRDFRRIGTQWGSIIRNLADIPFFADSNASRLIQCADHIAYAVFRRYHVGDSQLFDIIAPKFHSVDGIIHGLAHKTAIANQAQCLCPACLSRRIGRAQSGPQHP